MIGSSKHIVIFAVVCVAFSANGKSTDTERNIRGESFELCAEAGSPSLFNCRLQSGDLVALCLAKQASGMFFLRKSHTGHIWAKKVVRAEQSPVIARNSATLILTLPGEKVVVFTDDAAFDETNPALSTEKHGVHRDEFCTAENNDQGRFLTINGKNEYFWIGNLTDVGLATPTEKNPDFPQAPKSPWPR